MPVTPIASARRRAALARRGLVLGSVLAFAAAVGLVRSSHPATAHAAGTTTATPATQPSSGFQGGFGQAEVSPATSSQAPSVSTGAS